jgi:DNA replication protein DnaC
MTTEIIGPDLRAVLKRLRLSPILHTLPERLVAARKQQIPHQDFLLTVLSDEVTRRDSQAASRRAENALLEPDMQLENWDTSATVTFDQELVNELATLRFVDANQNLAIVGPVGVGKTFIAHALGHIACRRGYRAIAVRADKMLKALKQARLDHSYDRELRRFIAVDLLIVDDFGLDAMDDVESRDAYDIFLERHRVGSMIITSNRGPDEWLATFHDPVRAQSAIDRFTSTAHDLVIEGDSYRQRLKPTRGSGERHDTPRTDSATRKRKTAR